MSQPPKPAKLNPSFWAYQEPAMGTLKAPERLPASTAPKKPKVRKPPLTLPEAPKVRAPRKSRSKFSSPEEREKALAEASEKFAMDRVNFLFQYDKSLTLHDVSAKLHIGYDAARVFMAEAEAETRGLVHNTHIKDQGRTMWVRGSSDTPRRNHPIARARIQRCWEGRETLTARELCELEEIDFHSARTLIVFWSKLGLITHTHTSSHGTKHWKANL